MEGESTGGIEDYKWFNDETNPDGRRKFRKTQLPPAKEEEKPVTRYHGPPLEREDREWYIKARIAEDPEDEKSVQEFMDLVDKYPGSCIDALNILDEAAQRDRLGEYGEKLSSFYKSNIEIYDPKVTAPAALSSATREFFRKCYAELGIAVKITDL